MIANTGNTRDSSSIIQSLNCVTANIGNTRDSGSIIQSGILIEDTRTSDSSFWVIDSSFLGDSKYWDDGNKCLGG